MRTATAIVVLCLIAGTLFGGGTELGARGGVVKVESIPPLGFTLGITGGYRFNSRFAADAEIDLWLTSQTQTSGGYSATVTVGAFDLAVVGRYNVINRPVLVSVSAGPAIHNVSTIVSAGGYSIADTKGFFGIHLFAEVGKAFTPNFSLQGRVKYAILSDFKTLSVTLGMTYAFGRFAKAN
ncbi:MAG: outer membrane beta-barrel protein [candidate division WOR-3 bacterium]|nr:outer membrane beta-barrel protein [candidate division WOR-3 bacterium]